MVYSQFKLITLSSLAMLIIATAACWAEDKEVPVIQEGSSVSIEYTLKLDDGTTVDSNVGEDPMVYKQGGNEILPALESALLGLAEGATKEIRLSAEQGYGPVQPEGFQEVELEMVPEDARIVGTMLMATAPDGQQQPIRGQLSRRGYRGERPGPSRRDQPAKGLVLS